MGPGKACGACGARMQARRPSAAVPGRFQRGRFAVFCGGGHHLQRVPKGIGRTAQRGRGGGDGRPRRCARRQPHCPRRMAGATGPDAGPARRRAAAHSGAAGAVSARHAISQMHCAGQAGATNVAGSGRVRDQRVRGGARGGSCHDRRFALFRVGAQGGVHDRKHCGQKREGPAKDVRATGRNLDGERQGRAGAADVGVREAGGAAAVRARDPATAGAGHAAGRRPGRRGRERGGEAAEG